MYEEGVGLKKFDKDFGKKLTDKNIRSGIETFFHNNQLRKAVIPHFIAKLNDLLAWFEHSNTRFSFVGTSLLLMYDGTVTYPKENR